MQQGSIGGRGARSRRCGLPIPASSSKMVRIAPAGIFDAEYWAAYRPRRGFHLLPNEFSRGAGRGRFQSLSQVGDLELRRLGSPGRCSGPQAGTSSGRPSGSSPPGRTNCPRGAHSWPTMERSNTARSAAVPNRTAHQRRTGPLFADLPSPPRWFRSGRASGPLWTWGGFPIPFRPVVELRDGARACCSGSSAGSRCGSPSGNSPPRC